MAEHSHKSWAVNWFLKKFQQRFSLPKLFQTVFFFFWGGGGGGGGEAIKSVGQDRENRQVWQDFPYEAKQKIVWFS